MLWIQQFVVCSYATIYNYGVFSFIVTFSIHTPCLVLIYSKYELFFIARCIIILIVQVLSTSMKYLLSLGIKKKMISWRNVLICIHSISNYNMYQPLLMKRLGLGVLDFKARAREWFAYHVIMRQSFQLGWIWRSHNSMV